jgi:hypothetical protein
MEEQYDVTQWTRRHFLQHVTVTKPPATNEGWDAYKQRLTYQFRGYNKDRHDRFLDGVIRDLQKPAKTTTTTKTEKKVAIWSEAYIYSGNHWKKASHAKTLTNQGKRTITNKHEEQKLFSTMELAEGCWIGFVQNEWPCKEEGCCAFFEAVSLRNDVEGVIFNVQNSGGYAKEHGRKSGSSGRVYFYNGEMSYTAPTGANAPPLPY